MLSRVPSKIALRRLFDNLPPTAGSGTRLQADPKGAGHRLHPYFPTEPWQLFREPGGFESVGSRRMPDHPDDLALLKGVDPASLLLEPGSAFPALA